jgi:branched-chain amino acid transport system permease protein
MTNKTTIKVIMWFLFGLVCVALPKMIGPYYTGLFITIVIFAVYAVSLNMLLGYTGLLSFGHAIFFGFGGYGTALALKHIEGISLLPAIGIGVLASVLLAVVVSPIASRVRGAAFAMVHLALGMFMYTMALKLRNITGGEDGIGNFPTPGIEIFGFLSISMEPGSLNFYYLVLILLGGSLWLMWFFTKTPFGQVQQGIRDNLKRINYLGYQTVLSRGLVYVSSAAFAGLAGSVYGVSHNLVSADGHFYIMASFTPITACILGGIGSFFGPILGTGIFFVFEEIVAEYTDRIELVVGTLIVLAVMFTPMGIMGLVSELRMRWVARRSGSGGEEKAA